MAENHLSGAQVQAIETKMREAMENAITQMNLRKWAIDLILRSLGPASRETDVVCTAESICTFITKPATDVLVKIEQ